MWVLKIGKLIVFTLVYANEETEREQEYDNFLHLSDIYWISEALRCNTRNKKPLLYIVMLIVFCTIFLFTIDDMGRLQNM